VPLRSRNDILCFKRALPDEEWLVALNCCHEPRKLALDQPGRVVLSTCLDREGDAVNDAMILRADEGVILRLYS
jgi:alpha-glucosidase